MMKGCRAAAIRLSKDVDGELYILERIKLQAHLALCGTCREIQRHFRLMSQALESRREFDDTDSSAKLSEKSASDIKEALRHEIDATDSNQ